MKILARAVGRRKEAVAQVQLVPGTGQFIINNQPAADYLQGNAFSLLKIKEPFEALISLPPPESRAEMGAPSLHQGIAGGKFGAAYLFAEATPLVADAEAAPMDTLVKVKGGGLIGQVDAIKLGVARALCKLPQSLVIERRKLLRNFLTQDSRVKERKKYGLVKSRKAKQFSKR
jgi:small subunit ribosomal protein S9